MGLGILVMLVGIGVYAMAFRGRSLVMSAASGGIVLLGFFAYMCAKKGFSTHETVNQFFSTQTMLILAIFAAVPLVLNVVLFRLKPKQVDSGIESAKDSDFRVAVCRVRDTASTSVGFTESELHHDGYGNLSTTHDHWVETTHQTWVHNLETGMDERITGKGNFLGMKGHIIGMVWYKKAHLFTYNYSAGAIEGLPPANTSPLFILKLALGFAVFGPLILPLMMILIPFNALGLFEFRDGGIYGEGNAPGTKKIEAIMTYAGAAVFALVAAYFSQHQDGLAYWRFVGVMTVILYVMIHFTLRAKNVRFTALYDSGFRLLKARYKAVTDQQKAKRDAAPGASPSVPTAPAQPA